MKTADGEIADLSFSTTPCVVQKARKYELNKSTFRRWRDISAFEGWQMIMHTLLVRRNSVLRTMPVKLSQRFYEEAVQAAHHADIPLPLSRLNAREKSV
jgi:hypothetical protein